MNTAERLNQVTKELPEIVLAELLDFAEFLRQKRLGEVIQVGASHNVFTSALQALKWKICQFSRVNSRALPPNWITDEQGGIVGH